MAVFRFVAEQGKAGIEEQVKFLDPNLNMSNR